MIITYTFNTDAEGFCPTDLYQFQNAKNMASALGTLSQEIHDWYRSRHSQELTPETLQEVFYNILHENGIDIEKLAF